MTGVAERHFDYGPWHIISQSAHILESKCVDPESCHEHHESDNIAGLCTLCRFIKTLRLPSHPDMTFANNVVRIEYKGTKEHLTNNQEFACGIEFNCLDALRRVDIKNYVPKVAIAQAWREARQEAEHPKEESKSYDWSFTTDYKGTVYSKDDKSAIKMYPTTERINLDKLRIPEPIEFYEDLCLFEDELSDHGVAKCSVKMRVMKSGFFVLLRYFLRIDRVLFRMNDTRYYHESGSNYVLREYTQKERNAKEVEHLPVSVLTDPNAMSEHLHIIQQTTEKLELP